MTQNQAPAKKELPSNDSANAKLDSNKSASDVSNPPQNSTSLSTVGKNYNCLQFLLLTFLCVFEVIDCVYGFFWMNLQLFSANVS